jgi:hypothetical protein
LAHECLNTDGVIVVSDANWSHPFVRWELYKSYWKTYRPLSRTGESTIYYVTDEYKDPESGERVPMAMERVFSFGRLKRKITEAGFRVLSGKTFGHIPKSTIAELFFRNLESRKRSFDSLLKWENVLTTLPLVRRLGRGNFIVAAK